jgi:hypothetical protein
MVRMCVLVYSCFVKNISTWSWLTTCHFYNGGVTDGIRAISKLSARSRTLKMTNNVFTVRNIFYPHKDYSSFLSGKLTLFKLYNYGIMQAKVTHVIFLDCFRLFCCLWSLFCCWWIFVELLELWVFILLFMPYFCFMLSIGMSGVLRYWSYGHSWRLMNVVIHLLQIH